MDMKTALLCQTLHIHHSTMQIFNYIEVLYLGISNYKIPNVIKKKKFKSQNTHCESRMDIPDRMLIQKLCIEVIAKYVDVVFGKLILSILLR